MYHNLVIHSSIKEHFGFFQAWVLISKAAISTGEQVFMLIQMFDSTGLSRTFISSIMIDGSYGKTIKLCKNCRNRIMIWQFPSGLEWYHYVSGLHGFWCEVCGHYFLYVSTCNVPFFSGCFKFFLFITKR